MSDISFNYLRSLFDDSWDLGVLTPELFHQVNLHPIKGRYHYIDQIHSEYYCNSMHYKLETNVLVLVREGHMWDYTHYSQALNILEQAKVFDNHEYYMVYANFKEAAICAGLGVRAKNSLVYSYKFGFDHHIACIRFVDTITDIPKGQRVNHNIWNRCVGCDDCAKACPVGAIHNTSKNPLMWWIDSPKCENFIGLSDHPTIPSIKKFWHENVYPELSDEYIKQDWDYFSYTKPFEEGGLAGMPWDRNGYSHDGQVVWKDGKPVDIPVCRECTSQPRCSKWNGKYPY